MDSKKYSTLSNSFDSKSASSNRRELIKKYGIASTEPVREPIVAFDVNASIHPRNINKSAIVIAIKFTPPKPVISIPTLPDLPDPPTFNIQLGSFCNYMTLTVMQELMTVVRIQEQEQEHLILLVI